uniref:Neurobeachin alpha-solenoid region domain-containing protein n=1 Tax=Meloidogyne incognita TaxID=6306 RepID=A0A914M2Y7_MELIC
MDSHPSNAVEDDVNSENNKKSDANFSPRGATPTVLTSFSEALNEKNFEENEMRDVQLYEEICSDEDSKKSEDEGGNVYNEDKIGGTGQEEGGDDENEAATSEKHLEFESLSQIKNSQLGKTVVIHSNDETPQETFSRLKDACIEGTLTYEDIMDGLFNTLVGGPFDLESRYVLQNCENVKLMLELTDLCPPKIQAEIWSIFVAIVKKSFLNLEICSKSGLVSLLLDRLPDADFIIADLFIQLLTVLTGYSISVKEFKHFLKSLKVDNNCWESLSQIKNSQLGKTVVIHSNDETPQETFSRLKDACIEGTLTYEDIMDGLFNTAEIWSIFVAIVKKSFLNLEICSKSGLVSLLLDRLPDADFIIADLFIQLLTVLTGYSISVKEFKHFLKSLKVDNNCWKRNSIKLLNVMAEMPKREGPDVFFAFPGKASAGIFIPPLNRWPHQNGWTFCTWFRMDPLNSVYFEREKPFLFKFVFF